MIALFLDWLKRRRNKRCAEGFHYWCDDTTDLNVNLLTTRCTNCGATYYARNPLY